MKKQISTAFIANSSTNQEQICSLNKEGPRIVESYVTGEKFEFNSTYDEQSNYMDFHENIIKSIGEKFIIQNSNIAVITNYFETKESTDYDLLESIFKTVQSCLECIKKIQKNLSFSLMEFEEGTTIGFYSQCDV